jgi:hypothetical protein
LIATPADVVLVWPIKPRGPAAFQMVTLRGVGFRLPDDREFYFWTRRGRDILRWLWSRGFPVATESEPARRVWRGVP